MTWKQFLTYHTSGENGRSVYVCCVGWLKNNISEADAWAQSKEGGVLLWLAQQRGYADEATLRSVQCACVNRVASLAHDVLCVTEAIERSDIIAAKHEVMATEAIEASREDAFASGESKASYAASLLLSESIDASLYHAAAAKRQDAQAAYTLALIDGNASKEELQVLESAPQLAYERELAAQADIVRRAIVCRPL